MKTWIYTAPAVKGMRLEYETHIAHSIIIVLLSVGVAWYGIVEYPQATIAFWVPHVQRESNCWLYL